MKKNKGAIDAVYWAVHGAVGRGGAVSGAVWWDVDQAVWLAVRRAVEGAVERAVNEAANRAVDGAVRREATT